MKSIEIKLELRDLGEADGRNEVTEFKEWLLAEKLMAKKCLQEMEEELEEEPWKYSGAYDNMYAIHEEEIEDIDICLEALETGVRPKKETCFGTNILDMEFAIYYNHGGRSDRK